MTTGGASRTLLALFAAVGLLVLPGCGEPVAELEYEIVATFPHDTLAYTQGLLYHEDRLYESAGRYGESSLRKVEPRTGEVVARVAVDSAYFAEGLARVDSRLIQLTWKEEIAFVYDLDTLERVGELEYSGEGWGLCYDGAALYMSDGSSTLVRRDPETFEVEAEIPVTRNGFSVRQLNELECVGDHIYANVFPTNEIVRIDKRTGTVTGLIDGYSLRLAARPPSETDAVLNGIAFVPETGVFLVTGKLWPVVLAIRIGEE